MYIGNLGILPFEMLSTLYLHPSALPIFLYPLPSPAYRFVTIVSECCLLLFRTVKRHSSLF